jgi:hypothetical protein
VQVKIAGENTGWTADVFVRVLAVPIHADQA